MLLCVTAFVQKAVHLALMRIRKVQTHWLVAKESWGVSGVYLFIYFYFILFLFLLECLWSAKMMRIEGQLAFTKPHLFGQFNFHQEPVLDQTTTNLQQNTIGLKFLDFNCILF